MELVFLALLIVLMALALGVGFPVAFALPGSAILTISLAAIVGYLAVGDADAFFAHGGPGEWLTSGVTNLRGVYWEVERDTLIAIPLFIFMGIMLQRSRIAEDLLVTMAQLFGPVPGGLGISVVFVGALLAATTGIVGATVVAMGLISLPAMLKSNYSRPLAAGTIAASGTLGQIIPPSIVLIILADQLASATDQAGTARKGLHKVATGEITMPSEFGVSSTSAGEMFLGAFVPGLVLVVLYMAFILGYALLRPKAAPTVRYEGAFNLAFFGKVILILVPPLGLIFLVLGSIIAGIATVNQAGAIGAAGALFMAGYRLRAGHKGAYLPAFLGIISLGVIGVLLHQFDINIRQIKTSTDIAVLIGAITATGCLLAALIWSAVRAYRIDDTLNGVMVETAKTTSLVFIILLGAAMLTAAFRAFGGEDLVRDFLNQLPGGFWAKFIIVMAVIFVLGFFLDFIEIAVVVVPIIAPILLTDPSANVTAVWLGVMIGLNVQTSFLTPPFGFALFYLRGVAPAIVKTVEIYKGVIAFIVLQLVALGIVAANPALVNYLPNRVAFTAETAPPPRNPKLQICIEEYVSEQFSENLSALESAIAVARSLDTSYLPKKLAAGFSKGLDQAEAVPALLGQAEQASNVVVAAEDEYRVVHNHIRRLQSQIRKIDEQIAKTTRRLNLAGSEISAADREVLERQIREQQTSRDTLQDQIPKSWQETRSAFVVLVKAETTARRKYRRGADSAYEPVEQLLGVFEASAALKALEGELLAMRERINQQDAAQTTVALKGLAKQFSGIKGAENIKSKISKSRRALGKKKPKVEKAQKLFDQGIQEFNRQMIWRDRAQSELYPSLVQYEEVIRGTLGVRQQTKMPEELALYVAACNSRHRDISLHF
ncbi:MAG: TRAP transporter large permease subunit [Arenicellales bacterium]|nr:TRAP transporter large permease subunit [Arenicellales bacterium]